MWYHLPCTFWKIQLDTCERMRMKKANNIVSLFCFDFVETQKKTWGPPKVPQPHFENNCFKPWFPWHIKDMGYGGLRYISSKREIQKLTKKRKEKKLCGLLAVYGPFSLFKGSYGPISTKCLWSAFIWKFQGPPHLVLILSEKLSTPSIQTWQTSITRARLRMTARQPMIQGQLTLKPSLKTQGQLLKITLAWYGWVFKLSTYLQNPLKDFLPCLCNTSVSTQKMILLKKKKKSHAGVLKIIRNFHSFKKYVLNTFCG